MIADSPTELRLTGVRFRYPRAAQDVLRHVDTTFVSDGTISAIVAPSGAGKTTMLAVLGGLLEPTEGSIEVVVDSQPAHASDATAWVLQSTNALSRRSTVDNVVLPLLSRGATRRDALVEANEALEAVGLRSHGDQPARTLSGGELQRLAIARALVAHTPFILADEPTGHLDDATTRRVISVLFGAVRKRGAGLILVTHDQTLVRQCDRVLLLQGGRLVE